MSKQFFHLIISIPTLERRNEFCNGGLNSACRNRDDHEEGHQGIQVTIIDWRKQSNHKEMIKEVEQVEEANADKHQSGVPDKFVLKT